MVRRSLREMEAIDAVAQGDLGGLRPLYESYRERVFLICWRILRDPTEAEDLVQEVFTEVWRRASQYNSLRGTLEAWISTIARTRALDRLRILRVVSRIRQQAERSATVDVGLERPDEVAVRRQDSARIGSAVRSLPSIERLAIQMAFFEGLSQTEIAERQGAPLGTVKTRARRGLNRLRALVLESHRD
jgi:RNA polymerase sigma-70 factor (ECF subfamily)